MMVNGSRIFSLVAAVSAVSLTACSGDSEDPLETMETGEDAGTDSGEAAACPTTGVGTLTVNVAIEAPALANVHVLDSAGAVVGDPVTETSSRTLPAGLYGIEAFRVRTAGPMVGPAYQPAITTGEAVCVREGQTATMQVSYTREPGSSHLWLTQSNGEGSQVMAFDAAQIAAAGAQLPSVSLETGLPSVGPLAVDGLGRLWVASLSGSVVGFNTARLGTSSSASAAPDIVLDGPAICGRTLPCGPRAMAFDAQGAMWVAVLDSIVKLDAASLNASGKPSAAARITSPDFEAPNGLAFDAAGNLWVAESSGAITRFNASRLSANIEEGPADIVIYALNPGPVMIGLGSPEGLVFDRDGNLWVGYFSGGELVRYTPTELATSAPKGAPIVPSTLIRIGVEALVTDLSMDEAGNLWLPGGRGALYRIDAAQLSAPTPALVAMTSTQISTVERIALNSVPGSLFITEPHSKAP